MYEAIKKEIVRQVYNAHEMPDSRPDKQFYEGKDVAYGEILSFIESLEKEQPEEPTIKGWVARDCDATLHFFSSECGDGEPLYDADSGAWGNATSEMIELPHQTRPFGDLNYWDEPIEVELEIHRV